MSIVFPLWPLLWSLHQSVPSPAKHNQGGTKLPAEKAAVLPSAYRICPPFVRRLIAWTRRFAIKRCTAAPLSVDIPEAGRAHPESRSRAGRSPYLAALQRWVQYLFAGEPGDRRRV